MLKIFKQYYPLRNILFVIGEHAEPVVFVFTYPYWESWEEKELQYGEIEMDLTKNKLVK